MKNYIVALSMVLTFQGLFAQQSEVERIGEDLRSRCSGVAYADHPQSTQDTFAFFVTRYKNKDYTSAYPFWKSILAIAPDIQPSVLQGGVDIMKSRYKSASDAATKTAIADTILALAEAMPSCLGSGDNSYIEYRVYQWYTYRKNNKSKLDELFSQYYAEKGNAMNPQFLLVWLTTSMSLDKQNRTGGDPVWEVYDAVDQICNANPSEANDQTAEKALGLMKQYKYLDSAQLVTRSESMYESAPEDFSVMRKCVRFLQLAKATNSTFFKEVANKLADNDLALYPDSMESLQYAFTLYKQAGNVTGVQAVAERMFELDPNSMEIAMYLAQSKVAAGQLGEAVSYYNKVIAMGGDAADIYYTIAGLYQASGSFSKARQYAEKALSAKPGWAKPHILIGRLYASSGSRCGEGTGWDSQVVVWAAIDEWTKAGGDSEAQRLISQYSKYLPTSQDIFMRDGVEDGGQYFVSCWIQRSVKVRPRP